MRALEVWARHPRHPSLRPSLAADLGVAQLRLFYDESDEAFYSIYERLHFPSDGPRPIRGFEMSNPLMKFSFATPTLHRSQ